MEGKTWKTASPLEKAKGIGGFLAIAGSVLVFFVYPLFIAPLQQSLQEGKWADGWTQVFRR